jgi:hypothetical protein
VIEVLTLESSSNTSNKLLKITYKIVHATKKIDTSYIKKIKIKIMSILKINSQEIFYPSICKNFLYPNTNVRGDPTSHIIQFPPLNFLQKIFNDFFFFFFL